MCQEDSAVGCVGREGAVSADAPTSRLRPNLGHLPGYKRQGAAWRMLLTDRGTNDGPRYCELLIHRRNWRLGTGD